MGPCNNDCNCNCQTCNPRTLMKQILVLEVTFDPEDRTPPSSWGWTELVDPAPGETVTVIAAGKSIPA